MNRQKLTTFSETYYHTRYIKDYKNFSLQL